MVHPTKTWLAVALLAALPDAASAAETPTVDAATLQGLLERLDRLEARLGDGTAPVAPTGSDALAALGQRLALLERKLELADEAAAATTPTPAVLSVGGKGVSARSPDGAFEFRLHGNVQVDQRTFLGDDPAANDTWIARRVEPILEGSLGPRVGFRIKGDFAPEAASLAEAYVDLRFDPSYTLRVGKFKSPVGLERLQSSSSLSMIERSFPTELVPNQDVGVQLQGELAQGAVAYALGAFNGAADGRDAPVADADDHVEFAGRVFFEPRAFGGLGFGLGASAGDKQGFGNPLLARYRTPGQDVFFNYRASVAADGRHARWSPQAYYYRDRLGLLGEWVRSSMHVAAGAAHETIDNTAWQVTASWVLSGEDAGYRGIASPRNPYAIDGGGWGAFELVARYGVLDVDDDAFPVFADPGVAATRARSRGLGLNWILDSNLRLAFNHVRTDFDGGAAAGADREDEDIFFSRVQVTF